MADFAAILKRAIDALGDTSSATRERIYQRARVTLANRLAVVGPTPEAVAERQAKALEEAIAEVECSFAEQGENGDDASTRHIEEHSAPRTGTTILAAPHQAGDPLHTSELSPIPHPEDPGGPTVAEPFPGVPGEAAGLLGGAPHDVPTDLQDSLICRITRLNGSALEYVHQLGWAESSICAVCHKWALCIDQTHCWQRPD